MQNEKLLPRRSALCPYATKAGFCLNSQCPTHALETGGVNYGSGVGRDLEFERMCVEDAINKKEKQDRLEYLKQERKLMGMQEPTEEESNKVPLYAKKADGALESKLKLCPPIDASKLPKKRPTMRLPARKLCMLDFPSFKAPQDDYNDLSNFLRISTMPGYSSNDYISQYKDTHNMAVWHNRKDIDRQAFKMTRDWLSVWSENDVIERRWRKAWAEKFSA